jgi:hypothetical protein
MKSQTQNGRLSWRAVGPSGAVGDDGVVCPDYEAVTPEGVYTLRAVDEIYTRRLAGYLVKFTDRGGRVRHLTGRVVRSPRRAREVAAADYGTLRRRAGGARSGRPDAPAARLPARRKKEKRRRLTRGRVSYKISRGGLSPSNEAAGRPARRAGGVRRVCAGDERLDILRERNPRRN